jgi:NAD(P)H-dependent FMN reductase
VTSVLTLCGSLRAASYTAQLLTEAERMLRDAGVGIDRLDAASIPHYNEDNDVDTNAWAQDMRARVAGADAILIATPTYNDALPSTVKAWVDWVSRPWGNSPLQHRRIGLITASTGSTAGVSSANYLANIVGWFKANHVGTVSVAKVSHMITGDGQVDDSVREQIASLLPQLLEPHIGFAKSESRYVLSIDGIEAAFADYTVTNDAVELPHTVTHPQFRGQGLAGKLVGHVLDDLSAQGVSVIPTCPYVATFIAEHPQYQPLLRA